MSYRRVILAGLIASIVMGMWEMVAEQVAGGNGFWAPVTYIAATVLRDYQEVAAPASFALLPVVLGLMAHMMNSVVLGVIFAQFAPRLTSSFNRLVGFGAAYGVVVFFIMWFVVLPIANPVMLRLSFPFFLLGHVMWGTSLGVAFGWMPNPQPQLGSTAA